MATATHSLGSGNTITSTIALLSGGTTDPGGHGSVPYTRQLNYDGEINVGIVGTELQLKFNPYSAVTFDVTATPVGGGSPTTNVVALSATNNQDGWSNVSMISGLTDQAWDIKIKQRSMPNYGWIAIADTLVAVGSTPSFAASTAMGTQFVTDDYLSYIRAEGDNFASGPFGPNLTYINSRVRFKAQCTAFSIWSYLPTTHIFKLYIDGVPQSGVITSPAAPGGGFGNGYWSVATGLDGTAVHTYTLESVAGGSAYFYEFMFFGGPGLYTGATLTRLAPLGYIGDSIVYGAFSPNHAWESFVHLTSESLGYPCANRGNPGDKIASLLARESNITGLTPTPPKVFVLIGVNDAHDATTPATFQASYQTLIQDLCDALPTTTIYFGYILLSNGYVSTGTTNTYNGYIATAFAAAARSNSRLVNTSTWYTDTNGGLHPNAAGNAEIATHLTALWTPSTGDYRVRLASQPISRPLTLR